jgi:hypothetical protein
MWTTQGWQICPYGSCILSGWDLDVQQGLFKLTMKSNAIQAMVEVVALASDKINHHQSSHMHVVSDPCITIVV